MGRKKEILQERFEAKFRKGESNACWNWTAFKILTGYGMFKVDGMPQYAHRVAYRLYVGDIPDNLHVLHRCDNPSCVNPAHLFLGTHSDNMNDCKDKGRGINRGRGAAGEKNGQAKLTEEQVRAIRKKRSNGARNVNLAKEFGVATQTISEIVCYQHWTKI